MGIGAPWFFAGMALLGLPVYLHLLRRHNAQRQKFSSLMFFERSTDTSVRRRRLTHLLLLAARLALLLLVVLAFTRPFFTSPASAESGNSLLLVVVDESASMGAGRRMEQAKLEALAVLSGKPSGRQAQGAAFASRFRLLGEPDTETTKLKAMVESLTATGAQSSYGELANALRTLARSARRPVEVHLFTDLQRTSMPPGFTALRLEPGTTLKLHDVASKDEPNWTVEDVRASGRLLEAGKFRMEAVVAGLNTPAVRKSARLLVNGKEKARRDVDIPANGRATVVFEGLEAPYGFARCEVVLDSNDVLAADDRFLFAVEKSDPRTVLFIGGARSAGTLLYLRNALEASAPGAWRVESGSAESLRSGGASRYALVMLADPGVLGSSDEKILTNAVRGGLPAFVIAGPAASAQGQVALTGDPVRSGLFANRGSTRFLTAGQFNMSHPALEDSNGWEGARFFMAAEIEPKDARILAKLGDGAPLLFEKKIGGGTVLVMTSPLDNLANDLPSHPAFVIFSDRALNYLAGGISGASRALVDEVTDLRSSGSGGAALEVLGPDGQRALSISESAKAGSIRLDRTGFWEIRQPSGRSKMIAVNLSRAESDLTRMPPESAELWQGTPANKAAGPSRPAEDTQRRNDLWPWFLTAACAAAAVEILLASRHMRLEANA